jgi:lipopolysaccharide transport system ATP-binding protein
MSNTAIKVENLSKIYRLGEIGTGTISRDMERWFKTKVLKLEDPYLKVGESNDRTKRGNSDIVYSLRDINFEIQQGDAVGIIGRNGAGKSTLLKILSRVTTPSVGKINIKGRVASLLEVGTGFHPELTGRENIYLNGAILGMRKHEIDRKLDEIIDFSGVERYVDTPVKRYSSGMYVRLAFAVAAHLESEILIVDEVLAVGDAEFQKKCLNKMGDVSKSEGRTVLFVSHNLIAVEKLCNKGMFLNFGKVSQVGSVIDSIGAYRNVRTSILESSEVKLLNQCGDHRAQLKSVVVRPTIGEIINYSSGVTLDFFVQSLVEKALLDVSFNLLNNEEILVLHYGVHLAKFHDLAKCIYKVSIDIPPYTLNFGEYSVDAWIGMDGREQLGNIAEGVAKFQVDMSVFDNFNIPIPGIIRPKLNFCSEMSE